MKYFIFLVLLLVSNSLYSQTSGKDSIEDRSTMFANVYYHNGKKVYGLVKLKEIMRNHPESNEHMRKALNNYYVATTTGLIGGFVFGYSVGGLLSGKELNLPVAGASVGCIFLSYLFENKSKIHVSDAISKYNNRPGSTGLNETSLQLGFTKSGIGLALEF